MPNVSEICIYVTVIPDGVLKFGTKIDYTSKCGYKLSDKLFLSLKY